MSPEPPRVSIFEQAQSGATAEFAKLRNLMLAFMLGCALYWIVSDAVMEASMALLMIPVIGWCFGRSTIPLSEERGVGQLRADSTGSDLLRRGSKLTHQRQQLLKQRQALPVNFTSPEIERDLGLNSQALRVLYDQQQARLCELNGKSTTSTRRAS